MSGLLYIGFRKAINKIASICKDTKLFICSCLTFVGGMPKVAIAKYNCVEFRQKEIGDTNILQRDLFQIKPFSFFDSQFNGALNRGVFIRGMPSGIYSFTFGRAEMKCSPLDGCWGCEINFIALMADRNDMRNILCSHPQFFEVHPCNNFFCGFIVIYEAFASIGYIVMKMAKSRSLLSVTFAKKIITSIIFTFDHYVMTHIINIITTLLAKQAIQRWVDMTGGIPELVENSRNEQP